MLVSRFVEGRTLSANEVREPAVLERIVPLIGRCHRDIPRVLRGPILMFWVFHVLRDYAASLREDGSRFVPQLGALLARADELKEATGPIDVVFGHNDLLAANFIDDGKRLWLIDWEYAGFNSPLFDLGGLASNSELTSEQEDWLLERYFERPPDAARKRSYRAMKCASLLRESMWSMVSEMHSRLDVGLRCLHPGEPGSLRTRLCGVCGRILNNQPDFVPSSGRGQGLPGSAGFQPADGPKAAQRPRGQDARGST